MNFNDENYLIIKEIFDLFIHYIEEVKERKSIDNK